MTLKLKSPLPHVAEAGVSPAEASALVETKHPDDIARRRAGQPGSASRQGIRLMHAIAIKYHPVGCGAHARPFCNECFGSFAPPTFDVAQHSAAPIVTTDELLSVVAEFGIVEGAVYLLRNSDGARRVRVQSVGRSLVRWVDIDADLDEIGPLGLWYDYELIEPPGGLRVES
ncbi:MAG: hypothetical protein R3F59_10810 [Myxococcota bacterium]